MCNEPVELGAEISKAIGHATYFTYPLCVTYCLQTNTHEAILRICDDISDKPNVSVICT